MAEREKKLTAVISSSGSLSGMIKSEARLSANISKAGTVYADDYEQLKNLPTINGVVLVGNKTSEELKIKGGESYNDTELREMIATKADRSEIPTSLPADGGNADTVGGHTVQTDVPDGAVFTDTVYDDSEIRNTLNGKADKSEIPTIPASLPADGGNSETVNGHTVNTDVPADAKFTDTVYDDTAIRTALSDKADRVEIPVIPDSLPAAGGNSDTVGGHTVQTDVPDGAVFTDTVYDDTAIRAAIAGKADMGDIPKIPDKLPAAGGNSDTVDNMHAADFVAANPDVISSGTILQWANSKKNPAFAFILSSYKPTDLPSGLSECHIILLTDYRMSDGNPRRRRVLIFPYGGLSIYSHAIWNGAYREKDWVNIYDNVNSVGGYSADSILKQVTVTTQDLNALPLNSICNVQYAASDNQSTFHAPPIHQGKVTYLNVVTYGNVNRATQIASAPFSHQRDVCIRYKHDSTWSDWYKFDGNYTTNVFSYSPNTTATIALGYKPSYVLINSNNSSATIGGTLTYTATGFTFSTPNLPAAVTLRYIAFK